LGKGRCKFSSVSRLLRVLIPTETVPTDSEELCSESQEEKKPSIIEYQGAIDADGYRTYYAYIEDACSTFFTARPPPRRLKVYFSPKKGQGTKGYISPLFY
jgi:hypothetical protein